MGLLAKAFYCTALAACLAVLVGADVEVEDNVASLKHMEQSSKDGVIPFSQADFDQYGLTPKRPYTLVGYLYAKSLLDNPQLQLSKVAAEFGYAAQAFNRGSDADKVFFFSVAFDDHQDLFRRLGVNQAPFFFTWLPKMGPRASGVIDIPTDSQMTPGKTAGYPWKAEDFVQFVSRQSGLAAGDIVRPTLLTDPLLPVYMVGVVALLALTAYRAYRSPVVRDPLFWMMGSLVVYWFATSGGLFNIIRGMPMYIFNKERKMQFFLQGRQGQLGVEGFLMGGSYVLFSALLAAFVYGAPRIKDSGLRGGFALTVLITAVYLFWKIFDLFTFKNGGYWIRQFFF